MSERERARERRPARQVSEREIAIALVLELAQLSEGHNGRFGNFRFALMGYYDDDHDFVRDLSATIGIEYGKPYFNKLTKVVRKLVQYGVLHSEMRGTHKYYIGEPTKQQEYWLRPGKAHLLVQERRPGITMGPQGEAEFLLRHAYPDPDRD